MLESSQFVRCCPECNKELFYKIEITFNRAVQNNTKCKTCCKLGKKNPFFGKQHSVEMKEHLHKLYKGKPIHSKKAKNKFRKAFKGKNNPMYGKPLFDFWVERYGLDEAQNREKQWKAKLSIKSSGKNNPMYGKPAPKGSGCGWCGWYKDWCFRSLKELAYALSLDQENKKWISGEKKEWQIKYTDSKGKVRNYYPDFIVDGREIVEIKPFHMRNLGNNTFKKIAAIQFASEQGMEYLVVDPPRLPKKRFKELYLSGEVTLASKWKRRYEEKYLKLK